MGTAKGPDQWGREDDVAPCAQTHQKDGSEGGWEDSAAHPFVFGNEGTTFIFGTEARADTFGRLLNLVNWRETGRHAPHLVMKRRYDLLYAFGALLSSPFLLFGLLRTGKWRTDWKGRFGRTIHLDEDSRPTVLLHGVSVGEVNATRDLVARLAESETDPVRVIVSATTNTGFDRAEELYGDRMPVVRFPFDFSWMVGRFLDRLKPDLVALMELELWPNLAQECARRGIPLVVINGRLSDSSFGTYRWARRWVRPMFGQLEAVAAQTEEYAERFRELGVPADRVTVTDTMKWDTVRSRTAWREPNSCGLQWGSTRIDHWLWRDPPVRGKKRLWFGTFLPVSSSCWFRGSRSASMRLPASPRVSCAGA